MSLVHSREQHISGELSLDPCGVGLVGHRFGLRARRILGTLAEAGFQEHLCMFLGRWSKRASKNICACMTGRWVSGGRHNPG